MACPARSRSEFVITFGRDGEWTMSTPDDYTLADLPMLTAVLAAVEATALTPARVLRR